MYQQGYQDEPNGYGQEQGWYQAPPQPDAPAPRRRSRSRAHAEQDAMMPSPPPAQPVFDHTPNPPAGYPGGYGYASNGISHPADQPRGYAASYSSYTAPHGLYNQNGYGQQPFGDGGTRPEQTPFPEGNGIPEEYSFLNPEPRREGRSRYRELTGKKEPSGYREQGNGYPEPAGDLEGNYLQNHPIPEEYPVNDPVQAARFGERSSYPDQPVPPPYPAHGYQPAPFAEETPDPRRAAPVQPQNGYGDQNGYQAAMYQQPYRGQQGSNPPAGEYHPDQGGYASGYHPVEPVNSYRTQASPQPNGGKSGGGMPPLFRNLLISAVTLLVVVAGVLLILSASNEGNQPGITPDAPLQAGKPVTKTQAAAYATKFLPNVYVDGICLAEMTFQEGSDAVWAQAQEKQSGWYVRLKNENGSYKDITADMLGISFDPTSALQQAWAIGHTPDQNGQVSDKALMQAVNAALATEYHFTSAQQSANTSPIDTILDTLQTNAYRAAQDAVILSFNPDDFVNPFTFQQEVWGQWLDISAVKQEILNMVSTLESGEVMLQITPIAPNVTVADLQKTVTLRCRAVTPISSSSTEDRTNNIRVAMSKINGKSLAHGDKFSFNKFVGRRSIENGFFQAIEYAYGEEVMGVGGGVCQASTTVYLAAIQGGMTITNREAHSNPVNYTSLGMDATVSDTRGREVDFTFKNESGGRVFIAAHVVESGSNRRSLLCEVRIYGPSLEDVHYKLESETVEVLPKPEEPKLKEDKTGEHAFYVDETKQASKGREGYVVDTYLCTYQGDTMISRDKVSRDTYPARQDVMWVGVNER